MSSAPSNPSDGRCWCALAGRSNRGYRRQHDANLRRHAPPQELRIAGHGQPPLVRPARFFVCRRGDRGLGQPLVAAHRKVRKPPERQSAGLFEDAIRRIALRRATDYSSTTALRTWGQALECGSISSKWPVPGRVTRVQSSPTAGRDVVALHSHVGHGLVGVAVEQHLRHAQRLQPDGRGQGVGFGRLLRIAAQRLRYGAGAEPKSQARRRSLTAGQGQRHGAAAADRRRTEHGPPGCATTAAATHSARCPPAEWPLALPDQDQGDSPAPVGARSPRPTRRRRCRASRRRGCRPADTPRSRRPGRPRASTRQSGSACSRS